MKLPRLKKAVKSTLKGVFVIGSVFIGWTNPIALGQYTGTGTFTKITSVAELTDGYYVITNETDAFLMTSGRSGSATTGYFVRANSGASGGEITNPAVTNVWRIETNGTGKTIYSEDIARYVGWTSSNSATAVTAVTNNSRWTFSYSTGKWNVNNVAAPLRQLSYNNSDPRFAAYGNTGQHELQLYKLEEIACTPTTSVSSFSPTSGPAETVVTITGSGFNGATAVKFGTTDAISFTVIDDNTITAKVPVGIENSETIAVVDANDCEAASGGSFLFSSENAGCGGGAEAHFTDLFISEIYDSNGGSLGYIELFNPTASSINLSAYKLYRFGNVIDGTNNPNNPGYNIALTGTVAPYSTFVIRFGSGPGTGCSSVPSHNQTFGNGFNDNDRFFLMKNETKIDDVSAPNYVGYSITRNSTTGATSVSSNETCSDIGSYDFTPPSPSVSITHPSDVYELSTPASLSMNVTSAGGTNPTYQWYFNDPMTNNWMAVTPSNLPGSLTVSGANAEDLVISGAVPDIDGINHYQFYCNVLDGTCEMPSNAALFTIENPLPVTLTSFQATCDEKSNQMHLFWNTASETNSSHFTVEKSRSMAHWTAVSTVQAAGNSNDDIAYQATDQNPWSGITYYRLKQYDFDGKMEIFHPTSISCITVENAINVYPNPSNGNFTTEITWQDASVQTQMQIMDVTGKIVVVQEVEIKKGVQKINVEQEKFAVGTYLMILPNTGLKPFRIVIK